MSTPTNPNRIEVAGQMLRNAAAAVAGCGPVPPMELMQELRAAMRTWDAEIGADTRTRTLSLRVVMRNEKLGVALAAGLAPGEVLSLSQARRVAQVLTSAADMAETGSVRPGTPLTVVMGG